MDATKGCKARGVAFVKRCVDVPTLEAGVALCKGFIGKFWEVPVVGERSLDGCVFDAVVVWALVAFSYETDILSAWDTVDVATGL